MLDLAISLEKARHRSIERRDAQSVALPKALDNYPDYTLVDGNVEDAAKRVAEYLELTPGTEVKIQSAGLRLALPSLHGTACRGPDSSGPRPRLFPHPLWVISGENMRPNPVNFGGFGRSPVIVWPAETSPHLRSRLIPNRPGSVSPTFSTGQNSPF